MQFFLSSEKVTKSYNKTGKYFDKIKINFPIKIKTYRDIGKEIVYKTLITNRKF